MARRLSMIWISSIVVLAGCTLEAYRCQSNSNCVRNGRDGICLKEVGGYCAFEDSACPGGLRWDESAAKEVAGTCVGGGGDAAMVDAGTDLTPTTGRKWVFTQTTLGRLYDIWAASPMTLFAVGEGGAIHRSTDRGQTWTSKIFALQGGDGAFKGVWGSSPNDIFVVGGGGKILHSNDLGSTWADQSTQDLWDPDDVWGIAGRVFVAGWPGTTILSTTDGGQTWAPRMSPAPTQLAAVGGSDTNHLFAVGPGQSGKIIFSSDGSNWVSRLVPAGMMDFYYGCAGAASGVMLIVGTSGGAGLILRSTDGGNQWNRQLSDKPAVLFDIWIRPDMSDIIAVGSAGLILRSRDGGMTWVEEPSGTSEVLNAVWGVGDDVFAVGNNGTFLRYE